MRAWQFLVQAVCCSLCNTQSSCRVWHNAHLALSPWWEATGNRKLCRRKFVAKPMTHLLVCVAPTVRQLSQARHLDQLRLLSIGVILSPFLFEDIGSMSGIITFLLHLQCALMLLMSGAPMVGKTECRWQNSNFKCPACKIATPSVQHKIWRSYLSLQNLGIITKHQNRIRFSTA